MNSSPPSSGVGLGTVLGISIVVGLIVFGVNKYMADQNYVLVDAFDPTKFQPKGSYLSSAEVVPALKTLQDSHKTLKDSTDMMSQQIKNTMAVTANFFRSIGFIQISPNTVLISPATSGITTGYGGLPSCLSSSSPLFIMHGSPAFVNKLMAVKDADPNASVLKALLTAVKSIGIESFRWRRRQTDPPSTALLLNPYQQQLKTNLYDRIPLSADLNDITKVSSSEKTLLENFAKKYCFIINDFDPSGLPILQNLAKLTPTSPDTNYTTIPKDTTIYRTIINDIYRFYPSLLNKC